VEGGDRPRNNLVPGDSRPGQRKLKIGGGNKKGKKKRETVGQGHCEGMASPPQRLGGRAK